MKVSNLTGARILFVDDDEIVLETLRLGMQDIQCEVLVATDAMQALEILATKPADIVVSDINMPGIPGDEFLEMISKKYPETIRMVLSGHSDIRSVMQAVNQGRVWGYMEKPWDREKLIISLEQAMFTQKVMAERSLLKSTLDSYEVHVKRKYEGFVGSSIAMQLVYRSIEYAAPSQASVFITGPSGTGKEVAALAIHSRSKRKDEPFVPINCAAIPKELMESEIFGHIKGAFSGALSNRTGAATAAHGGTLFFDEIGEMDMSLQAKLLRFIQTGCFQRVGSDKLEKVDVRFICATNRDPQTAIEEKLLREDLYYRLNVISINMPALKDREDDVVQLAHHFLQHYANEEDKMFVGLSTEAEMLLREYTWPGNVRQLQNCIHSCVVMSKGPLLSYDAIAIALGLPRRPQDIMGEAELYQLDPLNPPSKSESHLAAAPEPQTAENFLYDEEHQLLPMDEIERRTVDNAIRHFEGNIVAAANALQVSPSTLYRKLQSWKDKAS